jgi:hypothetical protein
MTVVVVLFAASALAAQEIGHVSSWEGTKGLQQPVPVFTRGVSLSRSPVCHAAQRRHHLPGSAPNGPFGTGAERYGYQAGTILNDSEHMRITVTPHKLVADFVAAQTLQDGLPGSRNRTVLFSYDIPAR